MKSSKINKWLKRFLIVLLTSVTLLSVTLFVGVIYIEKRLDNMPIVSSQYLQTYETSKITDKHGNVIWQPIDRRIQTMTYEEIPPLYRDSLLAVEDREFWTNDGFSVKGIANMVFGVLRSKVDKTYTPRGGSTIDQQLIKNRFYDGGSGHEVTRRKIQEIFLARQLNENFSKEDILTFYVNDLEYAEGAFGVKTIMKTYFNKTPEDYLERSIENIAETAYLAGLSQAPSRYNLYENVEGATYRMQVVLEAALIQEVITQEEYDGAIDYDLTTNLQPRQWEAYAQHQQNLKYKIYTDAVRKEVADLGYDLDKVSLTIQTHLNPETFDAITNMARSDYYYLDSEQQIALTVIDSDGIVVAMVGGRSSDDELNRAIQETRSSGSSTKAFTAYAPLLQYFGDTYNTASLFDSSNYKYPGSSDVMHNYGRYTYGYKTMQESLRMSLNTPVARIDDEILGSARMKQFLHGVGLDNQDSYSSVDGIGLHISTLQNAAAFNALNNLGEYTKPRFVDKIIFSNGHEKVIEPVRHQAMNPSVAWVVNQMLRGVPATMPTSTAGIPSYVGYGGKTGSVAFDQRVNPPAPYGEGSSDVWFSSYTNQGYSVSVWAGYDIPNTSPQVPNRYKRHQTLSSDIQKYLNGDTIPQNWPIPEGVEHISGSNLQAHYRVTDAKDTDFTIPSWPTIPDYDSLDIESIVPKSTIESTWKDDVGSIWYEYYLNGGDIPPIIVDKDTYNKMKGGQ